MSGLDVEALLDSTAHAAPPDPKDTRSKDRDSKHRSDRGDRRDRDRDRHRDGSRERDRDRDRKRRDRSRERGKRDRDADGDEIMKSPSERGSAYDGHRSKKRSRSRDSDRRHSRRHRDSVDPDDAFRASGGDYYRGGGRTRTRSRSPNDDRYYRPGGRSRRDEDDRIRDRSPRRDRNSGRKRTPSPKRPKSKSPTPQPTEDERDRRTVFVQQLAARLRTKELIAFFEKVGPVKEAQIVKDRVSGRSKGLVPWGDLKFGTRLIVRHSVGYVEFKQEESVPQAIQLTGQKLLGIPIIAQLTEAEKNRQARNPEATTTNPNQIPFHRLYVGNIHFSITESDLQNVFEPFGELEFVQLQKEEQGRSRGYGFVQSVSPTRYTSALLTSFIRFRDPNQAREALEKMNGFDLAGRPIRVGLGNDKFTPESTANLLQRFQGQEHQRNYQGSAFSGHGGRGSQAGGAGGAFDRAGGRDNEKGGGGASALDDTDVAGVNFNNYSRDALMRKLARTDEPAPEPNGADEKRKVIKPKTEAKPLPISVNQASRCVLLRNMFNPAE